MKTRRQNTILDVMGRLIVQENGCCLWHHPHADGYGRVSYHGKQQLVHRVLYEHFVELVPEGMVLDHFFCDNRACGNFMHVKPVTQKENTLRSNGMSARHARRTHCAKGHPFSGDNLAISKRGWRVCRICQREAGKKSMAAYLVRKRAKETWRDT